MATLFESYITGDNGYFTAFGSTVWSGQTFTPSITHVISYVKLKMYRGGSPGTVIVSIKATDESGHPTGDDLCSGTTNGSTLPNQIPGTWRTINFSSSAVLSANTKYAIVVKAPGGGPSHYAAWRANGSSAAYARGCGELTFNGGSTWTSYTAYDAMFEEWGLIFATVTTDPATSVGTTSAILNGILGGEAYDCGFEWGLTESYGRITPIQRKTAGEHFSQVLTELEPDTRYHFRAFASNINRLSHGEDRVFRTLSTMPPSYFQGPFISLLEEET